MTTIPIRQGPPPQPFWPTDDRMTHATCRYYRWGNMFYGYTVLDKYPSLEEARFAAGEEGSLAVVRLVDMELVFAAGSNEDHDITDNEG